MTDKNKTRAERIEILAAIEHDQWMSWAKSLMENESLSTMRIDRWSSLMVPYSDLPEEMREHDRKWARLALDALPPDPPRGEGWNSLRKLREWAESKIVGADHPYLGPSAPASDDIWGAMVMMADRLLAYAPKETPSSPKRESSMLLHEQDAWFADTLPVWRCQACGAFHNSERCPNYEGISRPKPTESPTETAQCAYCHQWFPKPVELHHHESECKPAKPAQDTRGLFNKFTVTRHDGTDNPGGKHDGCDYFVLDLMHDMHAKDAILAYADACEKDRPQLAKDLRDRMGWAQPPAEPAQDDEAAIRDAEKRDEDRAKGDEPDPLEDNSILTSADIAELAEGAEMFVGDRVGGPKNRDIAEYEMVCSRSEYVAMARNLERFAREKADLRAEVERLRTIITAAATQIRVAHEKEDEGAPCAASNHYEEALNMLADHAGAWSPECAKLRDFTTLGMVCKENSDLRAFVAEWVDRFGFLAKRNKPDDICAIDEVACIITDDMDDLHAKLAAAEERIAAIVEWTHQYGANLCPFGNYTDSFGDGMRAAKEQVSRIAKLGKGGA